MQITRIVCANQLRSGSGRRPQARVIRSRRGGIGGSRRGGGDPVCATPHALLCLSTYLSKVCRSRYSTAVPSYETFCWSALRKGKCLPGTATTTARSTCCWPGYCLMGVPKCASMLAIGHGAHRATPWQRSGGGSGTLLPGANGVVRCCAPRVPAWGTLNHHMLRCWKVRACGPHPRCRRGRSAPRRA